VNDSTYYDNISEIEIDPSWRDFLPKEFLEYRRDFELAQKQSYAGAFPISFEIEASYYCNLQCPFCARSTNPDERELGHMPSELWSKIVKESKKKGLRSILMDHEAESLMNPKIFDMIKEAKDAGIIDIWLHTNANLLTPEISERLIDLGLTKINFSIDAFSEESYDLLRIGGNYQKVLKNIQDFLELKIKKKAFYLRARVSFVVQKENAHERKDFQNFWEKQQGINLVAFQNLIDFEPFEKPDHDDELSESELEEKYSSEPSFHCSQPWENNIIDIDGNVIPCGQPVREHTEDFILGNLNKGDTIESCWNGEKMKALKDLHKKGEWYKNSMCRACVKAIRKPNLEHSEAT
jgi:radical SAM protein with 4Fe4S-binding SPASM domain